MKIRIYLLKFAVALLAFVFGVAVFGGLRWMRSVRAQTVEKPSASELKSAPTDSANVRFDIDGQVKNVGQTVTLQTTAPTETTQEDEPAPAPDFDPTGEYYVVEEELSKAFKDLAGMELTARDYDKATDEMPDGVAIPPRGVLQLKKNYKLARIGFSPSQMAFETEKIDGVSYRFTGVFPQNDSCPLSEEDLNVALKGRLVKMKDGKKTAEAEIKFYMNCGC